MQTRCLRVVLMGAALVVGVLIAAGPWSAARAAFRSYNINTQFQVQPTVAAPHTAAVWRDFEHASALDVGLPVAMNASWNPVAQNASFGAYSDEWEDAQGRLWNLGGGDAVRIVTGTTVYVGPPWPFQASNNVAAAAGNTAATAAAGVSVNEWFPPFGSFVGNIWVTGSANAPDLFDRAAGFSYSSLVLQGSVPEWKHGKFVWVPTYSSHLSGSATAVEAPHIRDPITVRMLDTEGHTLLEDTLLDVWTEITRGEDPETSWQSGVLAFANALDGEFHARIDSPYIVGGPMGRADLVFQDGVITESYGDGIFAGLLPTVGSSSTFSVPFPSSIEFYYEYPELGSTMELDVSVGLSPEPATLALVAAGLSALAWRRRGSTR